MATQTQEQEIITIRPRSFEVVGDHGVVLKDGKNECRLTMIQLDKLLEHVKIKCPHFQWSKGEALEDQDLPF